MIEAVSQRIELPSQLVRCRAVVLLPDCSVSEAIAPIEVLIQEGLSVISVPCCSRLTPKALRDCFADRVLIGVHDVRSAVDAQWAVDQRVDFALTLGCDPISRMTLYTLGIPQCPDALTPTEVREAGRADEAAAVQVVPAGVLGPRYPSQLVGLVPNIPLIARGVDGVDEIRAWLTAGAQAVCLGESVIGGAFRRGNLASLRSRIRAVRQAID